MVDERLLQRMKRVALGEPFDRRHDLRAVLHDRQVRHELMRLPSTRTVQAPHWPWSHPFFVPVKSRRSRSRSSKVIQGLTSICFTVPLIFRAIELVAGSELEAFRRNFSW